MGDFPTRKHSDELIAAIVTANHTGLNASQITKQLNAGALATWQHGPYDIPYATVTYFVRKAKKEAAAGAHALHERASGDMHAALDGFGREIATELFEKLAYERGKKTPDIKKLAELASVMAKVKPLIKETPAKPVVPVKQEDAFSKKLRAATKKPAKTRAIADLERGGERVATGTVEIDETHKADPATFRTEQPVPAWMRENTDGD